MTSCERIASDQSLRRARRVRRRTQSSARLLRLFRLAFAHVEHVGQQNQSHQRESNQETVDRRFRDVHAICQRLCELHASPNPCSPMSTHGFSAGTSRDRALNRPPFLRSRANVRAACDGDVFRRRPPDGAGEVFHSVRERLLGAVRLAGRPRRLPPPRWLMFPVSRPLQDPLPPPCDMYLGTVYSKSSPIGGVALLASVRETAQDGIRDAPHFNGRRASEERLSHGRGELVDATPTEAPSSPKVHHLRVGA